MRYTSWKKGEWTRTRSGPPSANPTATRCGTGGGVVIGVGTDAVGAVTDAAAGRGSATAGNAIGGRDTGDGNRDPTRGVLGGVGVRIDADLTAGGSVTRASRGDSNRGGSVGRVDSVAGENSGGRVFDGSARRLRTTGGVGTVERERGRDGGSVAAGVAVFVIRGGFVGTAGAGSLSHAGVVGVEARRFTTAGGVVVVGVFAFAGTVGGGSV